MSKDMTEELIYDVFLSCRGGDTIETHADPLCLTLRNAQLRTFYYKDDPFPEERIYEKIVEGVKSSRSAVILLSKDFADSYWCLEELLLLLERERTSQHFPIVTIFCDGVSYKDLQFEENSKYYEALKKHKNVSAERMEMWWEAFKDIGQRECTELASRDKLQLERCFERTAEYILGKVNEIQKDLASCIMNF